MEIEKQKKLNAHIFRLLKVSEITLPIGRTNKGNLGIKFTDGQEDFDIMLDAVPLSVKSIIDDDNNIELKRMLEKYVWEPEQKDFTYQKPVIKIPTGGLEMLLPDAEGVEVPKKKGGRPVGSKNKAK